MLFRSRQGLAGACSVGSAVLSGSVCGAGSPGDRAGMENPSQNTGRMQSRDEIRGARKKSSREDSLKIERT